MARQSTTKQSNSFINGIVTDSNEFDAPENAALDILNVDINQKGEANRRKGLEQVDTDTNVSVTVDADEAVTQCVRWNGAGRDDRNSNITLCQEGAYLVVYDDTDPAWPAPSDTLDLPTVVPAIVRADIETSVWSFTEGEDGAMYLATGVRSPYRLFYIESSRTISFDNIAIYIRDTTYLFDGVKFTDRFVLGGPTAAPKNMMYNIMNGGWSGLNLGSHFFHVGDIMPAKSDQVWRAKLSTGLPDYPFIANTVPSQEPAPAGHYIWPLRETDRAQYTIIYSNTVDERVVPSGTGPSIVIFYASRVWYMGHTVTTGSPDGIDSTIFYSQVIRGMSLVGDTTPNYTPATHRDRDACYSVNDPTAEFNNEVLATDGGTISVPALGVVKRAVVIGSALIIFTNRGVYAIKGSSGQAFQADDFVIDKVSDEVAISFPSVVAVGSSAFFWSNNGIIEIKPSEVERGQFVSINTTKGRFHQGYLDIINNYSYKETVQGFYDFRNGYIEWTYGQGSDIESKRGHTSTLRINLVSNAITRYSTLSPVIPPRRLGGLTLFNKDGDESTMYYLTREPNILGTTLTTRWNTYSNDDDFTDFPGTVHENEILPYITLWPEHLGAPHLNKQALYLHTFLRRTEVNWVSAGTFDNESGITATAWFDWSENADDGKQSGPHDIYRMLRLPADPGSGYPVALDYKPTIIINRTKVKGKGRAIQLQFDGVLGKDFQLMGWSLPVHMETQ